MSAAALSPALQQLLDRAEIVDVVHRYMQAMDHGDGELYLSVLADDVELSGGKVGIEAARAACARGFGLADFDVTRHRTHVVGNVVITLDGDEAHGDVTVVSIPTGEVEGAPKTLVRGLRYLIGFRRAAEGWRIRRVDQSLSWMYEVVPTRC
ncbi:MAG: nuclear transport factor 2 family protein [Microbacteriaceae bacterium]